MENITKEECLTYTQQIIDYDATTIKERNISYNELYIYVQLNGTPDYDEYVKLCELLGIEISDEKSFQKWYKQYNKKLTKKIDNFSSKWQLNKGYIYNKLKEDECLCYMFIEEPGRKTLHQHYAAQWIKENIPFIYDFDEPINNGDNALYVENGIIITGKEKKNMKVCKSIDFTWKYRFQDKELKFYATHKYTRENGGSQDNQFQDVCDFLQQSRMCIDSNIVLLSITDGEYYQLPYTKYKGEKKYTKLEYMNMQFCGSRNKSTTCDLLLQDIIPFIRKWLNCNFSKELIIDEIEKLDIIEKRIKD